MGVAGGSGSGKTFFAQALIKKLGLENCQLVYQDNFYIDQSHRFDFDGGSVNFDHPESIDFQLLAQCLEQLKSGQDTDIPIYDFVTHRRQTQNLHLKGKKVVIVDGILIFHSEPVRRLLDELVFFDTPEELRFQRRIHRDVKERGRTPEGVRQQFLNQVKPMHDLFVEPSKSFASRVVREQGDFESVLQEYVAKMKTVLHREL